MAQPTVTISVPDQWQLHRFDITPRVEQKKGNK